RATSSAFAAASAAWRAARSFARRVSRARSAPTTTTAPAATAPTTRHRPTGRRADLAGARRAAPSTRARRRAGGSTAYAVASASSAASSSSCSSAIRLLAPEDRAQPRDAVADARLHRAERHPLARRDLGVREPLEVRDLDRPPLLRGQPVERRAEPRAALGARRRVLGTLGRRGRRPTRHAPLLRAALRRVGTAAVDRDVADDAKQPRPRIAARRVVADGAVPDAEERLLHRVLGRVRVARDAERAAERERREAVVERGERRLLAARDAAEERRLRVRRARHPTRAGPRRRRPATRARGPPRRSRPRRTRGATAPGGRRGGPRGGTGGRGACSSPSCRRSSRRRRRRRTPSRAPATGSSRARRA